ncbi:amidohydrolase [Arthrobacter sp. NamB2]|uniref:nitrilase-related carbon-nitrogen hydrolase n=1 Tax=Arthrobacter sp. NamB2 TaxID=2576035 RepID=UPI0010C9D1F3|nr:nitrilase-related carbon-nitrogen hydrolase [Arthrobacter sp. NamB2]TKV28585.1 amidohydrolase [Arthrobacter sp. NamB2]
MRVTLGQLASGTDTPVSLARMDAVAAAASAAGSRLVVFPEYATYEKSRVDGSFVAAAQPLDGSVVQALAGMARRHGVTVVAGIVETSDEPDRAYNTIVALDDGGDLVAAYRKIHLFDSRGFHESGHIKPAPDVAPVTFRRDGTVFGLLTCYDLRFPGVAQSLRDAGAQVVLAPSSWVPGAGKADQWDLLTRARALDNGVIVVAVSQAEPVSIGRSVVAGPLGEVIGRCGAGEDLLTVDLPLDAVRDARSQFPLQAQRRV